MVDIIFPSDVMGVQEARLIFGEESAFGIYQLKRNEEALSYRFEPYENLRRRGLTINRQYYELVYTAALLIPDELASLNRIYEVFNDRHPADFIGHSLSVSDVIVLQRQGQISCYYVDVIGFKKLPSFWETQEHEYGSTPV